MLTRNQFDVLFNCFKRDEVGKRPFSQREIADSTKLSLGTVNATLSELRNDGLVDADNAVTAAGFDALLPYKVDNAIIMAAGMSSRFAPISYEKPKGVLSVKGEVMVERQIRQLKEAGIDDITLVVGYKKEEFFYLEDMFGIQIVINPDYATRNNNSTIKRIEGKLGNTYICSSDDYFTENPFEAYVYESYYSAVFAEGRTDEYCIRFKGKEKRIQEVVIGGVDEWVMLGHVYWDRGFSQAFKRILDEVYEDPSTYGKLWEDIFIEHIVELPMVVRQYSPDAIWEFDSLDELRAFDPEFINNVDSDILDNICAVLHCKRSDIKGITPISQGLTNLSCRFEVHGQPYVYRHPGSGTDEIINRRSEAFSQSIASELGLDDTFIYEDERKGWKISRFIEDCELLDYQNRAQVEQAMSMLRTLHDSGKKSDFAFDITDNIEKTLGLLQERHKTAFHDFDQLISMAKQASDAVRETSGECVLCHNDFYAPNLLVKGDSMQLIDWEYSGMSDYANDLGTFICCSAEYGYDDAVDVIEMYFKRKPTEEELLHCIASVVLSSFYWFVWALYKDASGEPVGEWLYIWYKKVKEYSAHLDKLLA